MTRPLRTCRFCGAKGKWTIYVMWDADDPKIGTGKHKWWQCNKCDTDSTEKKERVSQYFSA
jgi:hypothetical protein